MTSQRDIMFSQVFICPHRREVSVWGEGGSVQGVSVGGRGSVGGSLSGCGLCLGKGLCPDEVSVWGVSVQGVFLSWRPRYGKEWAVRIYWNAFLLTQGDLTVSGCDWYIWRATGKRVVLHCLTRERELV